MIAIILASLLSSASYSKVELRSVSYAPYNFVGRNIEVCGIFRSFSSPAASSPSKRYIAQDGGDSVYAIYIEASHRKLRRDATSGCVRGYFRRVDGLSNDEARRTGKTLGVVDGINPLYMLFENR